MVQGYYTLEEAARILGVAPDLLSQMAQKREVRAFADRGTWRFRTQDIEELARRRGMGSDPDLQLGEAPRPKPHDSPAPKPAGGEGGFTPRGDDSDQIEIGQEMLVESAASGPKSGPRSPAPKPGSDSDVRLVADGSDVGFDVVQEARKKSDSGVRLVASNGSDSDVKIVGDASPEDSGIALGKQPAKTGTDSDIRLDLGDSQGPGSGVRLVDDRAPDDSVLTEEIDLDAELRKAEEAARAKKPAAKVQSKQSRATAPSEPPAAAKGMHPESSDFELTPARESSSPLEPSSDEMRALSPSDSSEEVPLGELPTRTESGPAHDSGINLASPADSGISLEQKGDGSDEIEFELSLDAESTSKPGKPGGKPAKADKAAQGEKKAKEVDSDSEFELTLDESGIGLAPLEEEATAQADKDKDIFETDFEVPALEDESGSQAVALDDSDTDLDSSDFDLALSDEDIASEEESGSQVVALEEEEADAAAATVQRKPKKPQAAVANEEDLVEEEAEAEEQTRPVRGQAAAALENWGLVPGLCLMAAFPILLLGAILCFEMVASLWGYRQGNRPTGWVTNAVASPLVDIVKE